MIYAVLKRLKQVKTFSGTYVELSFKNPFVTSVLGADVPLRGLKEPLNN